MEKRLEELVERGVAALEKLADDPEILVETKPPVCPHCDTMNPVVSVRETEGRGKLAEFVIRATCEECQSTFYVLPLQYEMLKTTFDAQRAIRERAELSGFNGREN